MYPPPLAGTWLPSARALRDVCVCVCVCACALVCCHGLGGARRLRGKRTALACKAHGADVESAQR